MFAQQIESTSRSGCAAPVGWRGLPKKRHSKNQGPLLWAEESPKSLISPEWARSNADSNSPARLFRGGMALGGLFAL
jgi:hypothetical protein